MRSYGVTIPIRLEGKSIKYKFAASDSAGFKIEVEFEQENLMQIIEQFECFLRGVGFVFDGSLIIAEES